MTSLMPYRGHRRSRMMTFLMLVLLSLPVPAALAQPNDEEPAAPLTIPLMTLERMDELVKLADEAAVRADQGAIWNLTLADVSLQIIVDPAANRMRILAAIQPLSEIDGAEMLRMMQANFDSALDARYAIARDILWSAFIHPFNPLGDAQFLSALAQTATAARTFGTSYTSGALTFGGGDSSAILRDELLEALKKEQQQQGI